ncbi:hypothetical protein AQUCO_01200009v1 [Aquilegia coerulea]|uniref:Uncharacterized protein n=1 Tax=Aquilegia coerulea TaxID=218851 RepID=A0A2G5E485_AQUCA|nr:hypothetical protein AQUCO_01200009v1 [Aquilegia coerulea]
MIRLCHLLFFVSSKPSRLCRLLFFSRLQFGSSLLRKKDTNTNTTLLLFVVKKVGIRAKVMLLACWNVGLLCWLIGNC